MKTRTKLIALALSTVLMSVVMSGLTVNAKKPLRCEKTLYVFDTEPHFRGVISGDIEGYFCVYSLDPLDERPTGQVVHYRERWAIFEDITMTKGLLGGTSTALSNWRKADWHAQGTIEWVNEEGPYADLLGYKWHSSGIFVPQSEWPGFYLFDLKFRMC